MEHIEQRVSDAILEKGVRVKLPAPFLLRLVFIRNISLVLRQPGAGTLLHVARLSLQSGFNIDSLNKGEINEVHRMIEAHAKTMAKICAVLFLNGKWKIRLFARPFANWLMWKLTARKMAEIALLAVVYGGYQDFTTTIRLIATGRITTPKNLSPDVRGS